jgi:hypothetical protein
LGTDISHSGINGNEAHLYVPQCNDQDKAKLAGFGVAPLGRYECGIDRVADPAELFAGLNLREPASKMVRE